jgi:hypothetical protein
MRIGVIGHRHSTTVARGTVTATPGEVSASVLAEL